jgi:hypothetical protein
MFYRRPALYHIPRHLALSLEDDENRQKALTGGMGSGIVGASHRQENEHV